MLDPLPAESNISTTSATTTVESTIKKEDQDDIKSIKKDQDQQLNEQVKKENVDEVERKAGEEKAEEEEEEEGLGIKQEHINGNHNINNKQQPTPTINLPTPDIKILKKKLNGYVGFANLPKQWHRRSVKEGFNFNLLVVGETGLGKSTLINTLFNKDLYSSSSSTVINGNESPKRRDNVEIKSIQTTIEENGVKLHLNIIDTPGFADQINNEDSWIPIVDEINSRFDSYLEFENRIDRTNSNNSYFDERIHALLYFIEPTGHSLKPLDIEFLLKVHKKVNIIPIIAKSDTLIEDEILEFKQRILKDIELNQIEIFKPKIHNQDQDQDHDDKNFIQNLIDNIPFAIVGSTNQIQTIDGRIVRGRQYPWGIIEVDNSDHNDFIKLRDLLIRNFLIELKEKTSKELYENYRTNKLIKLGIIQDDSVFREFDPNLKQQEEKALHEIKLQKLEADMKQIFQQKVSEKEKKLQKSEAELFARHKEVKEKLLKQIKQLEEKKKQLENQRLNPQSNIESQPQKTRKGFLR
ncbi:hypothetical protein WICMUC_001680 [Wickerhamomyces mucosus]|uniref:Septin-type G domain-containing protein n=1 Tax=Wickerhamomyces mucosus TaxID=1378264 RepID=A0A9P8PTR4_9ASCO|nr:hypothetical protein WICMUC_001680 [Wickerhamomyces mucosus]